MKYLLKLLNSPTFFTPCRKSCLWSTNHALKAEIMLYVAFWYHSVAEIALAGKATFGIIEYSIEQNWARLLWLTSGLQTATNTDHRSKQNDRLPSQNFGKNAANALKKMILQKSLESWNNDDRKAEDLEVDRHADDRYWLNIVFFHGRELRGHCRIYRVNLPDFLTKRVWKLLTTSEYSSIILQIRIYPK